MPSLQQYLVYMIMIIIRSYVQYVYMYRICSLSIQASSSGVINHWTGLNSTELKNVRCIKGVY